MRLILLLLLLSWSNSTFAARVAIVIDDIGYRSTDHLALDLPGSITYSVLPHTPFGQRLANRAHREHRDVLLHIPMEAENGKELGPGALTSQMDEANVRASLRASFAEIPYAIGINNHMGSLLTQLSQPMSWTMRFLKERNALFLDSKTTRYSKATTIARRFHVPALNRSVFLDNQLDKQYIRGQFLRLIAAAKAHKNAVAIAHPHPETISALRELLPLLSKANITLVPLSDLLPKHDVPLQVAAAE